MNESATARSFEGNSSELDRLFDSFGARLEERLALRLSQGQADLDERLGARLEERLAARLEERLAARLSKDQADKNALMVSALTDKIDGAEQTSKKRDELLNQSVVQLVSRVRRLEDNQHLLKQSMLDTTAWMESRLGHMVPRLAPPATFVEARAPSGTRFKDKPKYWRSRSPLSE